MCMIARLSSSLGGYTLPTHGSAWRRFCRDILQCVCATSSLETKNTPTFFFLILSACMCTCRRQLRKSGDSGNVNCRRHIDLWRDPYQRSCEKPLLTVLSVMLCKFCNKKLLKQLKDQKIVSNELLVGA